MLVSIIEYCLHNCGCETSFYIIHCFGEYNQQAKWTVFKDMLDIIVLFFMREIFSPELSSLLHDLYIFLVLKF